MGNRGERGEGKISIIEMALVSQLQRRIAFLPFHFQIAQDYRRSQYSIYHAIALAGLLILSCHVFYTVETEISACMAYIYYSDP